MHMSADQYKLLRARQEPEKHLQASIVRLARMCGYLTYHTYTSTRSTPGFPDLVLVRRGDLLFLEIKSEKGMPTAEQVRWLEALQQTIVAPETHLVRPADWDWLAERIQRGRSKGHGLA